MRSIPVILAVLAVVALSMMMLYAQTEEKPVPPPPAMTMPPAPMMYACPMHPEMKATWAAKCPKCGGAMTEMKKEAGEWKCPCPMCTMMRGEMGMMHEGRMTMGEPMMMRHQMMMHARVAPLDPAAVLAVQEQLDLSPKQIKKLETVYEKAQSDAKAVLTDKQRKELAPLEECPKTMMGMHRQMMMMHEKMMGKGKMEMKGMGDGMEKPAGKAPETMPGM